MNPGDDPSTENEGSESSAERHSAAPTTETQPPDESDQLVDHSPQDSQRAEQVRSDHVRADSLWRQFRTAEDGPLLLLREVSISVGVVLLFGLLLFGLSGVWPPMVAVESESMEPNISQYDLILVTDPGRFTPEEADQTGVVTAESTTESEYESFNRAGSVVVYENPGSFGPPIIHRAHFFVEEGENWYDRANPDYVSADSCDELNSCPAPYAGYITKGDNAQSNSQYDQANGIAPVVKPAWITGVARLRLPHLGYIRLALTGAASVGPLVPAGVGAIGAGTAYAIGRRGF